MMSMSSYAHDCCIAMQYEMSRTTSLLFWLLASALNCLQPTSHIAPTFHHAHTLVYGLYAHTAHFSDGALIIASFNEHYLVSLTCLRLLRNHNLWICVRFDWNVPYVLQHSLSSRKFMQLRHECRVRYTSDEVPPPGSHLRT